jgi:hypothetical protein
LFFFPKLLQIFVFSHVRLSQNSIRNSHFPFIFFFCETPLSFFSFAKLILKFLSSLLTFFPLLHSLCPILIFISFFRKTPFSLTQFSHLLLSFCRTPTAILFLFSHPYFAKTLFLLSYFFLRDSFCNCAIKVFSKKLLKQSNFEVLPF